MTPKEIKKIAQSYGESVANSFDYDMFANPDFKHKLKVKGEANKAQRVLEWLSKDFVIVPKEQIYMRHGVANALMEQDRAHREFYRGQSSVLESIFGKDTFEEEEGK